MEINMRTTRETLLKLAKDYTTQKLAPDRNVTAVFLVGSLRPENALPAAVLDVDLLVIYNGEPLREREIVKISNEIHLDIAYENASLYAQPRELRGDPWRGWAMWDPQLLYEKGRFFEYTQAIVRAQFDDVENLLKRCRSFSVPARMAWNEMFFAPESASPLKILTAASNAANAFASLSGAPLPERTLVSGLASRAEAAHMPELAGSLLNIITGDLNMDLLQKALPAWERGFQAAAPVLPDARIHPVRLKYYKTAIEAQLAGKIPAAAFWPMLHTWALAMKSPALPPESKNEWDDFCQQVGLAPGAISERIEALDAFLDTLEETLEQKASESGI